MENINTRELEIAIEKYGDVVVTKNSKNDVIIMSVEEYKKKLLKDKVEKNLLKAEEDIEKGRTKNAEEVFKEWNTQYGI